MTDRLIFREDAPEITTSDFWYDLTDGGYIKPEDYLEPFSAQQVSEALKIIMSFEQGLLERDLITDM